MRNFWLFLLLASAALAQEPTKVRTVGSLPATCRGGTLGLSTDEVVLISGGVGTLNICTSTNTWGSSSAQPWSSTLNPTGNLTLSMGANLSTFNYPAATVAMIYRNSTSASGSGSPQNSPHVQFVGSYWNGSSGAADTWDVFDAVGTGTNGTSTLSFSQSGSPGTAALSAPNVTTPGSVTTTGSNGGWTAQEGTGAGTTPAANFDTIYPDSLNHCWHAVTNNVDIGCLASVKSGMVSLATDATVSSTAFVNLTGLAVPLLASTSYEISCSLTWTESASTAALNFEVTQPGSPTATVTNYSITTTAGASSVSYVNASISTPSAALGPTAGVTTAAPLPAQLNFGILNGSTGGTWQLKVAPQGAGTLVVKAGSFCFWSTP